MANVAHDVPAAESPKPTGGSSSPRSRILGCRGLAANDTEGDDPLAAYSGVVQDRTEMNLRPSVLGTASVRRRERSKALRFWAGPGVELRVARSCHGRTDVAARRPTSNSARAVWERGRQSSRRPSDDDDVPNALTDRMTIGCWKLVSSQI
jgi:hypothetical protein